MMLDWRTVIKKLDTHSRVWYWILCILVIILLIRMFKRTLRKIYRIIYAFMMNWIVPRYNRKMGKRKVELFSQMHNMVKELNRPIEVLEIGAGSGANFQYYPKGTNIMCADPNPHFASYLRDCHEKYPHVNIREFLICKGEDLSQLLNSSVDAVVCTLVMCSVDDVDQCLKEILRVLRPGGKFFYMEHVSAEPNTSLHKVQRIFNPLQNLVDGCNLTRETWANVERAGFSKVQQERFRVQHNRIWKNLLWPPVVQPHLVGVATK